MASTDSAQRISVGQFRAQARRSSTNVASSSNSPSVRPISLADSQINTDKDLPPPRPPRAPRPTPSPVQNSKVSSSAVETSSESSSEQESDSDGLSPSRSRPRVSRERTITQRSRVSRSDIGHGNLASHHRQTTSNRSERGHGSPSRGSSARRPPPSSFQKATPPPPPPPTTVGTRSFSLYRRQQASYSTSELSPSGAAQRASVIAAAKAQREWISILPATVVLMITPVEIAKWLRQMQIDDQTLLIPIRQSRQASHLLMKTCHWLRF